jgi:G2/mitotic-specific cyclin-B, other
MVNKFYNPDTHDQ